MQKAIRYAIPFLILTAIIGLLMWEFLNAMAEQQAINEEKADNFLTNQGDYNENH